MDIWRRFKRQVSQTVTNIFRGEDISEELFNIDISCIYEFKRLFKEALRKYKIWKGKDYLIEEFIADCHHDNYHQSELLGIEYYQGNGGYLNNSHFLFGKASQFRAAPF